MYLQLTLRHTALSMTVAVVFCKVGLIELEAI